MDRREDRKKGVSWSVLFVGFVVSKPHSLACRGPENEVREREREREEVYRTGMEGV